MNYSLGKQLKKEYRNIKRFYKDIDIKGTEHDYLVENFYIIHRHMSLVSRKSLENGEFHKKVGKYLVRADYIFSSSGMMEYFKSKNIEFNICDIYDFGSVISSLLITAVGRECSKYYTDKKINIKRIMNCVVSLRKLSDLDTDDLFEYLCPAERMFKQHVPFFNKMDTDTKQVYRESLVGYARKNNMTETQAIRYASDKAGDSSILTVLKGKKNTAVYFYIAAALIFAGISALAFWTVSFWAFFALPSIYDASLKLSDFIFSHIIKPDAPLRFGLDEIPDNAKTLVVTTTLLFGEDKSVFDRLEEFYLKNMKSNLYFGVLGDFADSRNKQNDGEAEIIEYAEARIQKLNEKYGDIFSLFMRDREYNEKDNIYSGRERKRGAVCDLVSLISGENHGFAHIVNGGYINDIAYVLTLDGDTNLPLGGVAELLGIMLHPDNKPVVENGRVVKGYAMLQPCMKTELKSSYKTYFSLLQSGDGGNIYERAFFDRYQTLFGSGVFCGKGLFDVKLFNELISKKMPDNIILSHDMPEGCILRCMLVTDVTFTDSTPKNTVSYFTRLHRWVRGDIQNSIFLKGVTLGSTGKYKIGENIRRHLIPVITALGLVIIALLRGVGDVAAALSFLFLTAYILVPSILGVAAQMLRKSYTPRRFFSLVVNSFMQSLAVMFFEISALLENAYVSADAVIRSVYRMVKSKKNLLEWTTFSQSDSVKKDSLIFYIQKNMASAFIGTVMFIFSPWVIYRLAGFVFFLFPVISYMMSKKIDSDDIVVTNRQKEKIKGYALDSFKFFTERVNKRTHFLPPDNVQLSPTDRVAYRTSPTNIGLYLLSLLVARDFGFIDSKRLYDDLNDSVSTIERLEKWNGHLYNWYDIKNLKILGNRYISTVDSGNFITMLITLAEGVAEYSDEEPGLDDISKRCHSLIGNTDFLPLYNRKKNLFYLGYDESRDDLGEICYDLMMSEIRTTCYYACAYGIVPKKHWQSLGRTIVENDGFIGMVSWSGTAFEYFMPELFLPEYKNSFISESLQFAYYNQRKHKRDKVFGISESGFHSFDSDMNYQYKAHGVPAIALKKYNDDEYVISPYSSFLMLGMDPEEILKNLDILQEKGVYGEYGFYEAYDLNRAPGAVVRSYMSHHIGMSMLACANVCMNDIIKKRFLRDKRIAAATELLCEKVPTDVHLFDDMSFAVKKEVSRGEQKAVKSFSSYDMANPETALITGGNLAILASGNGHIGMRYGSYHINNAVYEKYSQRATAAITFFEGEKIFGCTPLDGNTEFSFEKSDRHFAFISSKNDFTASVTGTIYKNEGVFAFKTKADYKKSYSIGFTFMPVLDKAASFYSHQAFSSLFVISDYDANENVLLFERRFRSEGERFPVCGIALGNKNHDFDFTSSAEGLDGQSVEKQADYFNQRLDGRTGVCINPMCVIKTKKIPGGEAEILVAAAYTKTECVHAIKKARLKNITKKYTYGMSAVAEAELKNILFPKNRERMFDFNSRMLWKAGISGDYPLCVLNVFEENRVIIKDFINAFASFAVAFIRTELVFILNERDKYLAPLRESILQCIKESGCERFLNSRGGIFIVGNDIFTGEEFDFIKNYAALYMESDEFLQGSAPQAPVEKLPHIITKGSGSQSENGGHRVFGGYMEGDTFTVCRDQPLKAPYSYIISGRSVGSVVTETSLGFTFFMNAREKKLTPFETNPYYKSSGEKILIYCGNKIYDACACSNEVKYSKGAAVYYGEAGDKKYILTVYISPLMPFKIMTLDFEGDQPVQAAFICSITNRSMSVEKGGNYILYSSMKHGEMNDTVAFVTTPGRAEIFTDYSALNGGNDKTMYDIAGIKTEGTKHVFILGACPSRTAVFNVFRHIDHETPIREFNRMHDFVNANVPDIVLDSKSPSVNSLFSYFAPYQASFSRIYGKTGFYQTGGAYGFRDQLQDCLCLVYSNPEAVRTHIIRAASHQYVEGDVMHWWLKSGQETYGIRTKCSDDYLFLPYTVADYIKKTGDYSVLDVKAPYLTSPPLDHGERYEKAEKSDRRESIYMHCIRAIAHGEKFGSHGISLMGSCDWNDAFSNIGVNGRGESVFTSWLYVLVIKEFLPIFDHFGDTKVAEHYKKTAADLIINIEKNCYDGDRYLRAFFDDGTPIGVRRSAECRIDILSQCFAAIVLGKTERTLTALNTAYDILYDRQNKLLKLFDPPFDRINAGYIRGYSKGVRENGGQYTHAAIWAVWGLIKAGETEKALELMAAINPAAHASTPEEAAIYKIEPYVITADIYSGEYAGRGGWSWYTGSAAWYYKIMLEEILGVQLTDGFKVINVDPKIEYRLVIKMKDYTLNINVSGKNETNTLDGEKISLPFRIPGGEHFLNIGLK